MPAFIPAAVGAVTGIVKTIKGAHQNNLANKVKVPDATYNTSPYAQAALAQMTQYKNSRMAGAGNAENNIMSNQASTIGAIDRNSMSGAQALAMIAGAQGNTNQAFNSLNQQEGQDQYNKMNMWNNANTQMVGEDYNAYQDRVRKQNLAINEKSSLRNAATQNFGNGMNDLGNAAMSGANAYAAQQDGEPQGGKVNNANPMLYSSDQFRNNNGMKVH